jgi:type III secretion control protein HpaP
MADLRRIAFKLLKVHRPAREAEQDAPPPAPALRKGPTFAEVLARRHGAVARPAVAADVVDAAPARLPGAVADAHPDSLALELGSRIADALQTAGPLHDEPGRPAEIELEAKAARNEDDADAEPPLAEPLPTPLAPPPAMAVAAPVVAAVPEPTREHNLAVAQYLADTVARFCGDPAVARGEGWQVQLTLDAELLRDTTLHLSLSPHWLTLRFVTQDKRARALVLDHQGVLEQLLEDAVVPRREIAITVE